jgi:hypothetical protein
VYETFLRASGPAVINSSLIVARNEGQATGIQVENFWLGSVPVLDAFDRAVRQPLESLTTKSPRTIALLVDGLDESLGADQTTIADLIATLAEPPGNIKILVTTKPDHRVLGLFPDAKVVDLDYGEYRLRNAEDLAAYIQREIGQSSPETARGLAAAANGNFMYARHVMREADPDLLAGSGKFPQGLSQLYDQYLGRLVPKQVSGREAHADDYVALLGLLSVAFEPLTTGTIGEILGMSQAKVNSLAADLQQILAFTGDNPVRIQYFHSSMADFVANQPKIRSAPNPYYTPALEQHLNVIDSYVRRFGDFNSSEWSQCDSYGLQYLAAHVSTAIDLGSPSVSVAQLYDLVLNQSFTKQQLAGALEDAVIRAGNLAIDAGIQAHDLDAVMRLVTVFSRSDEILLNGLATTALVRWHNEYPGLEILAMLRDPSPRVRRVATNAAYRVGLQADLIAIMARDKDEGLQQNVAYMTNLEWGRGNRSAVMKFAGGIADGIRWTKPIEAYRRTRFLGHCLIFIYTANPNDQELISWGDHLFSGVLSSKVRGPLSAAYTPIKWIAVIIAGQVLSRRVAEAVLSANLQDPREYFRGSDENRELLKRAAALLEPATDWIDSYTDLVSILDSNILFIRGYGAAVCFANYLNSANKDQIDIKIRETFCDLSPRARLWQLLSFTALFPEMPDLRSLVAWQTKYILEHDRDFLVGRDNGQLKDWNVFLLPLGLACGKGESPMVEVTDALLAAIRKGDYEFVEVLVESLGLVGFYCPNQALPPLAVVCDKARSWKDDALVEALSTIAVIHSDQVDVVLRDTGRLDLRADVLARSDIAKSQLLFDRVALFSNSVNQAWRYPILREMLVRGTIQHMASAKSPRDFTAKLTRTFLQLLRGSDHQIGVWGRQSG